MGRVSRSSSSPRRKAPVAPSPSQLSGKITQQIRERILNWHYPPGHHLGEHALCAEFGSSRVPVREALNTLAEQGLVDRVPNHGCYVKQPDLVGVHQLYDLRLALELFVVERLSRNGAPPELIARERAYWEPLLHVRADDKVNGEELMRADEDFHLGLARAIDNPYLLETLVDVYDRIRFVRMTVITTPHRIQATAGEHLAILKAIEKKDGDAARRALWQNINQARNKVEIALQQALAAAAWRKPVATRA